MAASVKFGLGANVSITKKTKMPSKYCSESSNESQVAVAAPTLGALLREMRRRRAMSQKALALEAGLDQSVLAAMESGRRSPPRDAVLKRLMSAFNATEDERVQLERGRLASRLSKVLSAHPALTRRVIVEIALIVMRVLDNNTARTDH